MPRQLPLLLSTDPTTNTLSLFILLSAYSFLYHHSQLSQAYNVFIYGGCSQEKYQPDPNSPFTPSLNSLLASFVSSSTQTLYNSFTIENETSVSLDAAIYGLYQCRGDLKVPDCTRCVKTAVSQISLVCPYSYGAALQLEGCYVQYEHVNFLGQLDTSLRYKKCSKARMENDVVEFTKRRDDVLANLKASASASASAAAAAGDNGFWFSRSGSVEGFVQCTGDLTPADCSSCRSEVVGQLKSLCESAAAADVFLAQCYARYWASGYYDFSQDSSNNNDDEVGKTVAIIVGSVAGLAVLVVALSICRKAAA